MGIFQGKTPVALSRTGKKSANVQTEGLKTTAMITLKKGGMSLNGIIADELGIHKGRGIVVISTVSTKPSISDLYFLTVSDEADVKSMLYSGSRIKTQAQTGDKAVSKNKSLSVRAELFDYVESGRYKPVYSEIDAEDFAKLSVYSIDADSKLFQLEKVADFTPTTRKKVTEGEVFGTTNAAEETREEGNVNAPVVNEVNHEVSDVTSDEEASESDMASDEDDNDF